jgi:hypothetical protein
MGGGGNRNRLTVRPVSPPTNQSKLWLVRVTWTLSGEKEVREGYDWEGGDAIGKGVMRRGKPNINLPVWPAT